MYSRLQLAKKYLQYYFKASNGKGHGIHSPFVFDFVTHVLNDKTKYDCYREIENVRKKLLQDERVIEVEDLGAGSSVAASNKRSVQQIARSSLKNKKLAQLLFRIANYYKAGTIIELGTSLGITTLYLAAGENSKIYTLEGAQNIAAIAKDNFRELKAENIELVQGNFDEILPAVLSGLDKIDLVFIDGNHRKEATLRYFDQLINLSTPSTILIFDDIHWSAEMEEAWKAIREHSAVTLSIDLFFVGIVFFRTDFKAKQHFVIRF